MNAALFIARRLGLRAAGSRSLSPGVIVGYIGISLAVVIMILAICIVSGFKHQITGKLLGFNAEITVYAHEKAYNPAHTSGICITDSLRNIIAEAAPGATPALSVRQFALFKTDTDFQGIVLKGLSTPGQWKFFGDNLVEGRLPDESDGANACIVSSTTASRLGLGVGQKVTVHFLDGSNVRSRRLLVTGIFDTHFHDFDESMAFTPARMLQNLNHVDSLTGTAVDIRGIGLGRVTEVNRRLNDLLIEASIENPANNMIYNTDNIITSCGQYLSWLDLLDTNVAVIIILMAFVSGFTLISSLFIIILERVHTIGLLKALGATNAQIRRIFIYMAQKLVITGIIVGNIVALALAWMQNRWHFMTLDPDTYYLSHVPVSISWSTFVLVDVAVIAVSVLVLILPSHIIARLSPASTLHYE